MQTIHWPRSSIHGGLSVTDMGSLGADVSPVFWMRLPVLSQAGESAITHDPSSALLLLPVHVELAFRRGVGCRTGPYVRTPWLRQVVEARPNVTSVGAEWG